MNKLLYSPLTFPTPQDVPAQLHHLLLNFAMSRRKQIHGSELNNLRLYIEGFLTCS